MALKTHKVTMRMNAAALSQESIPACAADLMISWEWTKPEWWHAVAMPPHITHKHAAAQCETQGSFIAQAVFVFTLDCDNGIYCYGAGDAFLQAAAWLTFVTL